MAPLSRRKYNTKPKVKVLCYGPECDNFAVCKGLCNKHNMQRFRNETLKPLFQPKPAKERFESKVQKLDNGCWLWLGGKTDEGYGVFRTDNGIMIASRYSYELYNKVKLS